jgi:hypothetical protein
MWTMRVRCVSNYLNEEQRAALGRRQYQGRLDTRLTIGKEYLVLAIQFRSDPRHYDTGPSVDILLEDGTMAQCELDLFEVSDPHASRHWQVHVRPFDGTHIVQLLPAELLPILNWVGDGSLDPVEQDVQYYEALRSDTFRRVVTTLDEEQWPPLADE